MIHTCFFLSSSISTDLQKYDLTWKKLISITSVDLRALACDPSQILVT